jgi:phage gp29-like protein
MTRVLDRHGNPISREVIQEPQTARMANLHSEFATHPTRGLTPAKLAAILEQAEQGDLIAQHDLYLDMEEKDAHIFAEMSKRRRTLIGLEWRLEPPRGASAAEKSRTEALNELILDVPDLEDVLLDALDAIGHGFANLEITWNNDLKHRLPEKIEHRAQSFFQVPQDDQNAIRLRDGTSEGEALWEFGWIRHVHKAKSGYISRAGLHRVLAWPFLFKAFAGRDLAELLEIYGIPFRLGKYPANATDAEKSTLLRAVTTLGHNAAGIIPEGMMIEFIESAKGSHDFFSAMMDWCERSESKAILGATLTSQTDSGSGAYALGGVHNEVRRDILVSDARQLGATLTRDLVYPIAALNGLAPDGIGRCPRFEFETDEPEDLDKRAERDERVFGMGFTPSEAYIQEHYGKEWTRAAAPKGDRPSPVASTRGQVGSPAKPFQPLDAYTGQLAIEADDAVTAMIQKIRAIAESVDNFDDFQEALLDAFEDLDPNDELPRVMQMAFATAELLGRDEILEES